MRQIRENNYGCLTTDCLFILLLDKPQVHGNISETRWTRPKLARLQKQEGALGGPQTIGAFILACSPDETAEVVSLFISVIIS